MTTTTRPTSSPQKIRRTIAGGKRAEGWDLQRKSQRIHRPDPRRIPLRTPDPSLSSVAGLVPFGQYLRKLGLDRELRDCFGHLKKGRGVVYPMSDQLHLIIDANAVGEGRVFGIENLAADPLFTHLAGGAVPSIDTLYRDLDRFGPLELLTLESIMANHGLFDARLASCDVVHLDIDSTVEPLFGSQEGALPGHNPRYHGRPSYHPVLSACAETRTCVGAVLKPGDTALGSEDRETIAAHVRRMKKKLRPDQVMRVRIDAAGDCVEIMAAVEDEGAFITTKARLSQDLCQAIYRSRHWQTIEDDVDGRPLRQVAEVAFSRKCWKDAGRVYRVIAVRTREEVSGKQVYLWDDLDYTVKAFITSDWESDAETLARDYENRAEIELMIREWKHDLGIGAVPTDSFDANHAMLLLKLLTHNLVRDYVVTCMPSLARWRLAWLRRVLMRVPGRILRTGNQRYLRLPVRSPLYRILA